ncbi:MAG: AAA family ATPase [Cardiobacteriaceae bacterium]|nr:AAA family ATPase [Cardiobacteriaceae bacterium]
MSNIEKLKAASAQIKQIIIGKDEIIDLAMICLLARGHILFEDLPGAGKTTLAKAFAATLGLQFGRVQFTSDLLPADIIGFSVLNQHTQELTFNTGAIFVQLLLADEINRASPKSQSALLEAMEERQVTVEQETRPLPEPFFVIATQNPLEQVGTYPLPESQLDRFLMRLSLGYPSQTAEIEILRATSREVLLKEIKPILDGKAILDLQNQANTVQISAHCAEYVQKLLTATRESNFFIRGLSTRAGLGIIRAAKAAAFLDAENAVLPKHIQKVFPAVVAHRLPTRSSDLQNIEKEVLSILENTAVPL